VVVIEIDGLVKRFGATTALDGMDLTVPAGSVCGLLGPNGAGKTTAVRILATLLRPDAGVVRVGGHDVTRAPERVRELIGLTGQFTAVDEALTGVENLLLVARLRGVPRGRVGELLEHFGLTGAGGRLVRTYSGGMRRRLDVAASLIGSPRLLVLDEPTTGLDPRARADVWDLIRGLVADGTTVLLTTQYLEEADRLADTISVIDHGRVLSTGAPAQLKARVGGQTLTVRPSSPAEAPRAAEILARVAGRAPTGNSPGVAGGPDGGVARVVRAGGPAGDSGLGTLRVADGSDGAGAADGLERRGAADGLERRGAADGLERRGAAGGLERRGAADGLERRGAGEGPGGGDGVVAVALPAGVDVAVVLAEVAGELGRAGIAVDEIGVRLASLDEVFLTLTGREVAA
jgi:oleandomycin transport system ATP-binding protein